MKQYTVTLTGLTPLIMHNDNLAFSEKITAWQKDPANKAYSVAGDDRSPAWTWLGYTYHDGKILGIPSDNLMTMLREGGAKMKKKGQETYKKQTQSGIMIDRQQWDLAVGGKTIEIAPLFEELIGNGTFIEHIEAAEARGFELLVKRAAIKSAKHVRVRPLFRDWVATGTMTILDPEQSGLTLPVLKTIFAQAGSEVGLCDWRPSSSKSSGSFGKFSTTIKAV